MAIGKKSASKYIMEKANVPIVPGYHGADQSLSTLKKVFLKNNFEIKKNKSKTVQQS